MSRIFVDSSVLFSAAYSPKGYSREILILGVKSKVQLVISSFVMEETRRNLAYSAPAVLPLLDRVFNTIPFMIFDPEKNQVLEASKYVVLKDAPILAAAKLAQVDILVTLDQKHLLDRPELEAYLGGKILRPKQAFDSLGL